MECSTYDLLRQSLFIKISETENQFSTFDDNEKFTFMLSNPDTAEQTSEYLRRTLEIRRFLIENPRVESMLSVRRNGFQKFLTYANI